MKTSDLTIIAFTDPAGGKSATAKLKRTSARSSIIVIGSDPLCRIFVLHAWAERCSTDAYVEHIYKVYDDLHPKIFGVEANAMQTLFGDMLSRESRALKKRVPFVPIQQPTRVDKRWRIRTSLQPVIAEGRLFLQDNQLELKAELSTFPMAPTVDLIDGLASAINLAPKRATAAIKNDAVDALAAYLRNSGATPAYIQQRVNQLNSQRG